MSLSKKEIKQIVGLELNAFNFSRIMPDAFEGTQIKTAGTPIYDINGTVLYYRFPIKKGQKTVGYADAATNELLGEPLLAVSTGIEWNERKIRQEAMIAAKK
ncbi:MAG: hypothetical protein P8Y46_04555 [Sulfurovaceae bacterium]